MNKTCLRNGLFDFGCGGGVDFPVWVIVESERSRVKPSFYLATLFARREAKTRIRQCDWLKLAGEKICREQVGNAPIFLSVRANKVAK